MTASDTVTTAPGAGAVIARGLRWARVTSTTPGLMRLWAAALVLTTVLAGLVTAAAVDGRAAALDDLAERSGPMSVATQEIYRSLSDADATANGTFLAGGLEPVDVRGRYENDVARAANALAITVAAHDPAEVTAPDSPLATISALLPVYTGLVETARANNRQGLPLGAAYQREASALMRDTILPAAQRLHESERGRVEVDQRRAWVLPFAEVLAAGAALGLLVAAQRFLTRRTNRVFNTGLLAAKAAMALSLLWVGVTATLVIINVRDSHDDGSQRMNHLAQARVATLKARADETLTLVARGAPTAGEEAFNESFTQVEKALAEAGSGAVDQATRARLDSAGTAVRDWRAAHTAMRRADDDGEYATAVRLVIGGGPESTGTAFDRLDNDLNQAIEHTRGAFDDRVHAARLALTGTIIAVTVLALTAAASAAAGIWQRLKEYR